MPSSAAGLPVRATDLLLVLIVSLGAVRLMAMLLLGLFASGESRGPDGGGVLGAIIVLAVAQTVIVLGAIQVLVVRKYDLSWADLGLRRAEAIWYRRAVVIAVLLMPAIALVNGLIGYLLGEPFQNPQIYAIAPSGFSWTGLLVMILVTGFVAPFSEEIAFRGLLFPWLRVRFGMAIGAVVSALAFAALHGIVLLIPALMLIGIVLAVLYQRSDSLWPAIVAHGLFNAMMVVLLYTALAAGIEVP